MVPCLRAASTASIAASEVLGASAAKMPPVWNQRTPSSPKILSQFTSPGRIWEEAELARSEQPSAARMPKPFSVKFKPTRVLRPMPSCSRQMTWRMSTPPWAMKSSTSQPRSLTGSAVTMAARLPKHLCMARATLYSPPPSHTANWRLLRTRPKPGSKRSITSPRETQSQAQPVADLLLDAAIVLGIQKRLGDEVGADAGRDNAGAEPFAQACFRWLNAPGRHDLGPGHRSEHRLDEGRAANALTREYFDDLAADLLRISDLRRGAAAGAVGNAAAVAEPCDIRIGRRADDEIGAVRDVKSRGGRIDHRAHAQHDAVIRLGEVARQLQKDVRREVAAVGELDAFRTAIGASLDDPGADFDVGVIEDRDHPLFDDRGQCLQTVPGHVSAPVSPLARTLPRR